VFQLKKLIKFFKTKKPAYAYDLLAPEYDSQTKNLLMLLDGKLSISLIQQIEIKNKIIVDFGCGTGRHWKMLYEMQAKEIIGLDVSNNMLNILKSKFPEASTHLLKSHKLNTLNDNCCNVLFSALTLGYLQNLHETFSEWDRILTNNAHIVFTDLHPSLLAKGAERAFSVNSKVISVRNYLHTLDEVRLTAKKLNWKELICNEIKIDEGVKAWYEKEKAMEGYHEYYGVSIIYGIVFIKA
jgi:ubiquinone/menaquinone biosynthesis C-methylase UbiE